MVSNLSFYAGRNISRPQNLSYTLHSKTLEKWVTKADRFEYSQGVKTYKNNEIERLFPNGELDKIYNKIAKDYGLDSVPELKLVEYDNTGDRGFHNAIDNSITIVLDFLKPEARKFLLEKDGVCKYSVGDSKNLFFRIKEEDIKNELNSLKTYGFSTKPESLTDDDKKKIMIFLLSHELSHAYQNQCIRHTEGLNEWNMLEQKLEKNCPKNMNLIDKKLTILNLRNKYNRTHKNMSFEKIYSQCSNEGKQALEWHNANIAYSTPEMSYEKNINNPLEINANERAVNYLKTNYGYFENAIEF